MKLRWLLGVFLPLLAWSIEMKTRICAQHFFDPLPGPLYSLLWLSIPFSNAWVALVKEGRLEGTRGLGVLCGVSQAVALIYTLWFLPLTLLSIVMIPLGLGLCSLSPLLALPVCLTGLRSISTYSRPAGRWLGVVLALGLMALAGLPGAVTYAGLQLARNPQTRARGLNWLRSYGDHVTLLEACYHTAGWTKCPLGMVICLGSPPPPEEVREIFFGATGTAFNDFAPPPSAQRFIEDDGGERIAIDPERGREKVGGRAPWLSLDQSSLSARVDPTGSTAVWDWDLTFANHQGGDREARCRVLLPPGGVASGAVLWVAGKPRKALIATRGKARQAYEKVVEQKRDPLLVTTSGPQRLMVQCFPVPGGGTMHIRLSVTAPLLQEDGQSAWLKPPCFLERNFDLQARHQIHVECALAHGGLPATVAATGLGGPLLWERVQRGAVPTVWCVDPVTKGFTVASWSAPAQPAGALWVVVDGSACMQPYRQVIASALREFRSTRPVAVLLAGDEVRTLLPLGGAETARMEQAARALEEAPLQGGQDDVAALLAAQGGQILWLHAGQAALVDVGPLRSRAGSLVSLACELGPNGVLDELGCREAVRMGSLAQDLRRQLAVLSGQRPDWQRLDLNESGSRPVSGVKTPVADLSRLWALGQGAGLADGEAFELASRYGLITPVSGAVVLESEEQERRLGLRPGEKIPVVPEPGTLVLLAALGWLLLVQRVRRRWP